MPALTYSFKSAQDMLNKLRREHQRLLTEVSGDNFLNFVVTAYHLAEWVEKDPKVPAAAKNDIPTVRKASSIATCRDLTNASKHFNLKAGYKDQVASTATSMSGWGAGRYGVGGYGIGEESITIDLLDGTSLNALGLAADALQEWESFFTRHSI
jgi:hypothetical protein